MSGWPRLSEEERQEMLQDAQNSIRGKVFWALKNRSQTGTLDQFMDFLSENIGSFSFPPSPKITNKFKL